MAKFVCILKDEKKDELADDLLNGHIQHIKDLNQKGILFLCGPLRDYKDDNTGMIIIEVDSMEEAKNHFLKDPFIIHKWYRDYSIYELAEASEEEKRQIYG
jgi:uncharacterized protein YciI